MDKQLCFPRTSIDRDYPSAAARDYLAPVGIRHIFLGGLDMWTVASSGTQLMGVWLILTVPIVVIIFMSVFPKKVNRR